VVASGHNSSCFTPRHFTACSSSPILSPSPVYFSGSCVAVYLILEPLASVYLYIHSAITAAMFRNNYDNDAVTL
jgi:hypothetical protein